ncbi:adhesion G-protein coupled receptor G2-like isoform X1 [Chelmon rostratus]|uniref:adhesion G-protein coupled receptor G2-like isoform X1 n=1 Tax=Chelmon rostratus TaxID=109905 RepID=UPI001BE8D998|nr:adhesion G-protein coupled receptor G2-like isoform X1 [Chelmon rostratus]
MSNLASMQKTMGNSTTAAIQIGDIKGVITKLSRTDQTNINTGITTNTDFNVLKEDTDLATDYSRVVHIPREAYNMAIQGKGSFAGVLLFQGIHQDDPSSSFLNNEMIGIEMGAEIFNLSHTIDIHYKKVDKKGNIASCRSWDGKGTVKMFFWYFKAAFKQDLRLTSAINVKKTLGTFMSSAFVGRKPIWVTDGCRTNEADDSITCQCSHLTFFAILMSPPPQNLSSTDFTALSYITSVGCGLSMFFLMVALFMHCLIRKIKASQATLLLINLFVAMFSLNLSFLVNESIAGLGNFAACVAIAAVMHYTMLATFTWFFIQALHLYFNLWKISTEIKHYMTKICITGWVTPAVVVIALLALGKYDHMVTYTDDGNSAKMCWISDTVVHQGVNISYYGIVFIFTFTVFIITVRQIVLLKPTAGRGQDISSIKTNSTSIMGLLLLLGLTWAFAFFSYGPLRIPSYYIFTILNSFQGFFLFIYYYKSSKSGEDRNVTASSSSTATSNTAVVSPYQ